MAEIPTSITREQGFAACRALGLDPALVLDLRLHPQDGATVTVPVRDRDGQVVVRGRDEVAAAQLSIPFSTEATHPRGRAAETNVYLRIGDQPESLIGSITIDPGDSGLDVQTQLAELLQGTAGLLREVADIAHSQDAIRAQSAATTNAKDFTR